MSLHPPSEITAVKAQLRAQMKALRATLPLEERLELSHKISEGLIQWLRTTWLPRRPGEGVAVYLATPEEVNIDEVARFLQTSGIPVAAPTIGLHELELTFRLIGDPAEMKPAGFRIREPSHEAPEIPVSLVLVPGTAFTSEGHRLGMGHGCYDRSLTAGQFTIGVAYPFQIVSELPVEPHDHRMHALATPGRVVLTGG